MVMYLWGHRTHTHHTFTLFGPVSFHMSGPRPGPPSPLAQPPLAPPPLAPGPPVAACAAAACADATCAAFIEKVSIGERSGRFIGL